MIKIKYLQINQIWVQNNPSGIEMQLHKKTEPKRKNRLDLNFTNER